VHSIAWLLKQKKNQKMKKQFQSKAEKRDYKRKRKKDYYNTVEEYSIKKVKKSKKQRHD